MPRKMRRGALRSALTVKATAGQIVMLDELSLPEIKTALMVDALKALTNGAKTLVLLPAKTEQYDTVINSVRNIPNSKLLLANYLNIRDLLSFDKVVIPLASLDVIQSYLG